MPEERFIEKGIKRVGALFVAFAAGVANGFFGGGGGMLIVPALAVMCDLDQKRAHATAIAVVMPLSVLSSILYILAGVYSVKMGITVGIGVMLGGVFGAGLLNKIPKGALTVLFYAVMIYAGIRLVLS